jgi:hypothetical protein
MVHRAIVFVCGLAIALFAMCAVSACSSKDSGAAHSGAKCDPAACAPGNECIDDGTGASCHRVCSQQADCPSGWYCNDGQLKSWCVANTNWPAKAAGQWGTPCVPPKESDNPACDTQNGFACYGNVPSDANAFCTIFGCTADSDCPGGWWCATVNATPNVMTATPRFGAPPRQVCLPREYCAPCQVDHDCSPTPDGQPQYCIIDNQGNSFCSPRCTSTSNCKLDASCLPRWKLCLPGNAAQPCTRDEDCPPSAQNYAQHCDFGAPTGGVPPAMGVCAPECGADTDCDATQHCKNSTSTYCMPRAGVCKGDGTFCSPCRSDADCTDNGFCLDAPYSHERFCSAPTNGACPMGTARLMAGMCPTPPAGATYHGAVSCQNATDTFAPVNQCFGVVTFGVDPTTGGPAGSPGCWTVNR